MTIGSFNDVDHVFTTSPYLSDVYRKKIGLISAGIPSPIDWSEVLAPDESRGFATFVNPSPHKGSLVFARLADMLGAKRPDIPIVVVQSARDAGSLNTIPGLDFAKYPHIMAAPPLPRPADFFAFTTILLVPSLFPPDVFDGSLQYAWPALFVTLLALGAVMLCYRKPLDGVLVVGPIVLAIVASGMGMYPVGTRVSLFLIPLLLLLVVFAADSIGLAIAGSKGGQLACLLLVPIAIVACIRQLPPKRPEHLRPVIEYVAGQWQARRLVVGVLRSRAGVCLLQQDDRDGR